MLELMVTKDTGKGFSDRLKKCYRDSEIPSHKWVRDLLEIVGDVRSPGAARKWLEEDSIPRPHRLLLLAKRFGKRPAWLQYGELPENAGDTVLIDEPELVALCRQYLRLSRLEKRDSLAHWARWFREKASSYLTEIDPPNGAPNNEDPHLA